PLAVRKLNLQNLPEVGFRIEKGLESLAFAVLTGALVLASSWLAPLSKEQSFHPLSVMGFFLAGGLLLWFLIRRRH
ncbi:MAG: hypothetical protein WCH11_05205, partial [Bdellovibrio sp.]